MRSIILTTILSLFSFILFAQQAKEYRNGRISYVTSGHIYVKFESTAGISSGDTLYINQKGKYEPVLTVLNTSSISCVCDPLDGRELMKDMEVFFREIQPKLAHKDVEVRVPDDEVTDQGDQDTEIELNEQDKANESIDKSSVQNQKISGRLSASSYSSFRANESATDPRMKYRLSVRGDHLAGTNLHLDSYLSFRHQINQWEEVTNDFNRAFKIYSLALSYETEKYDISLGRKVNRNISNIGAIDGLQFAYQLKDFKMGAVLGSRPDVYNYSFNFELPQVGLYVTHTKNLPTGRMQSTLGLFEQRSGQFTDRRFLYIQHHNSAIKNLFIFGSCEMDLYKKTDETAQNTFSLTSLYLSARYRFNRKYSLFVSYDNRRNIIYYETYKNTLDRLLEMETRQGFRLRFVLRPFKYGSIGLSGTYRYQKDNLSATKNANAYFNYSRLPFLKASVSLSYTYLNTYYMVSNIAGVRLRKDLLKGKMGLGLHYRWVNYDYNTSPYPLQNHLGGIDLNVRFRYDLNLSINYELSINETDLYHRNYIKLTKRIR